MTTRLLVALAILFAVAALAHRHGQWSVPALPVAVDELLGLNQE